MSTERVEPDLIEQTRQQIRGLVNEIAGLSRSSVSQDEFQAEFLGRLVAALAALGGAIWMTNQDGQLVLQYQINFDASKLREKDERQQGQHARLLHRVLAGGEGALVPPQSGGAADTDPGNPTDCLLLLGPLKTEVAVLGVVEIFQRPDSGPSAQAGYLRFLLQMCDLAADFFKSRQLRHFSDRQALWAQLEDFTRTIHASLEPRKTAYIIANEGRRLIECDRVSVALRKGRKCPIEAVSGQDLLDKRSNTVRLLGRLASEVVAAGEPVWYTGDTSKMAPQIESALQEYLDEAHSKTVAILPLRRPASQTEEDPAKRPDEEPPFGALIVEQIEDSRVAESMVQRVGVVVDHSGTALGNALEHHSLFLMPVLRAVGKSRWVLGARALPKTIAVAIALAAILAALVVVPYPFQLSSKGSLEPVLRRDVFAGIDGVVTELLVKHGDAVTTGQLLARLHNTELDVAVADVTGQRTTTRQRILSNQRAQLEENRLSIEERNRLSGELLELKQRLASLDEQIALYREKQKDLEVRSPMDGKVVTWDLHNRLIQRPVQRGQILMRVANPDGDWQLELRMAEDRMGHIIRAENALPPGEKLQASYILLSEPGKSRKGAVQEVHQSAEVRDEEGSTVLIKVAVDKKDLPPQLRPGATVTAKIDCGYRPIGYVLFHDLTAAVQSRVIFPWF